MSRKPKPSVAEQILEAAGRSDRYARPHKLDQERYRPFVEILEAFVKAKAKGEHDRGMHWLLNNAIANLNEERRANGDPEITCDTTPTTILKYARRRWPDAMAKAWPADPKS